jgi:hypothetical protein
MAFSHCRQVTTLSLPSAGRTEAAGSARAAKTARGYFTPLLVSKVLLCSARGSEWEPALPAIVNGERAMQKLDLHNRTDLVKLALKPGVIQLSRSGVRVSPQQC